MLRPDPWSPLPLHATPAGRATIALQPNRPTKPAVATHASPPACLPTPTPSHSHSSAPSLPSALHPTCFMTSAKLMASSMPGMLPASSVRKLSCAHSSCSISPMSGCGSTSCVGGEGAERGEREG